MYASYVMAVLKQGRSGLENSCFCNLLINERQYQWARNKKAETVGRSPLLREEILALYYAMLTGVGECEVEVEVRLYFTYMD